MRTRKSSHDYGKRDDAKKVEQRIIRKESVSSAVKEQRTKNKRYNKFVTKKKKNDSSKFRIYFHRFIFTSFRIFHTMSRN